MNICSSGWWKHLYISILLNYAGGAVENLATPPFCGSLVDWLHFILNCSVQFSSVVQLCMILCDPMDYSLPGFPVNHPLQSLLKLMSIESVMPSNNLILCHSLLLLPSIFPRIRVFSNESVLPIRWPKYWSFSFSTSLSNEYSGLISFRMD